MHAVARLALFSLVLALGACTTHRPAGPESSEPIQTLPGGPAPTPQPGPRTTPQPQPAPSPAPRSTQFAPPPGGNSHWDAQLGVHVLNNVPNTFYRQRTYYRWNDGWSWSTSPSGPWQDTDAGGVPPGLSKQFGK